MNFTKEEYQALLKMAYIANWVHEFADDDPNSIFSQVEQKLVDAAKDNGCGEFVEFDEESKINILNEKFEDGTEVFDVIEAYNEEILWNELSGRLAERDLSSKPDHTDDEADDLAEKYFAHFIKNGVDKIKVNL
jgi:hypothetical protein